MKQDKLEEVQFFEKFEEGEITNAEYDILNQYLKPLLSPNAMILEAGCGTGKIGRRLVKEENVEVIGVDLSPKQVKLANERAGPNYRAIQGDLENPKLFENEMFNVIICRGILHHFPSPTTVISNIAAWLVKGGYLLIAEPNGLNLVNFQKHLFFKSFRKFAILRFGPVASINETEHTAKTYISSLKKAELCLCGLETYTSPQLFLPKEVRPNALELYIFVKMLAYRYVHAIFPPPISDDWLVIVAKRL